MSAEPSASPPPTPDLPLAVTTGDPAGIGPDIALLSWRERVRQALPVFAVHGDIAMLQARARALGIDVPLIAVARPAEALTAFSSALPVRPVAVAAGARSPGHALVVASIEQAAEAVARGEALALVTNPIAKQSLQAAGLEYPGHTAFLGLLATRLGYKDVGRPVMMLVSDELKVVPATVHIPLAAVPHTLSRPLLVETIRITSAALTHDFGIARPRIAVTGLNPHAGEGGLIGNEELRTIAPAIAEAVAAGLAVTGPHSADALFHAEARSGYDAVVAMYHDQALIPLKTLAFDHGVNVTLGLPFVRTSPDHGTAVALAGTGKARPGSFIAALRLAHALGRRRREAGATAPP